MYHKIKCRQPCPAVSPHRHFERGGGPGVEFAKGIGIYLSLHVANAVLFVCLFVFSGGGGVGSVNTFVPSLVAFLSAYLS